MGEDGEKAMERGKGKGSRIMAYITLPFSTQIQPYLNGKAGETPPSLGTHPTPFSHG